MSKTLGTYMVIAGVMIFLAAFYYGLSYKSLEEKHEADVKVIDMYQVQEYTP